MRLRQEISTYKRYLNLKFKMKNLYNIVIESTIKVIPPNPPLAKGGRGDFQIKNSKIRNSIILHFTFLIFIYLIGVLLLLSCGKKEVRPVSLESKITQEAFGLAETIRNAYIKNDRETLERSSTKDGYRELIGVIKSFDSAELTFTPTWVEIEDSVVSVNVSWKGTWIAGGKRTEDRGLAVFVFEGRPLKLSQVLRANPFRQPE